MEDPEDTEFMRNVMNYYAYLVMDDLQLWSPEQVEYYVNNTVGFEIDA